MSNRGRAHPAGLPGVCRPYIDHEFLSSWTALETRSIEDPATGQVLSTLVVSDASVVDAALTAAARAAAAGEWIGLGAKGRARCLDDIADLIQANSAELAAIEAVDVGKPLAQVRDIEMAGVAESFSAVADVARHLAGEAHQRYEGERAPRWLHYVVRDPVGVVALVTPFNVPLLHAARKLASALGAGNAVVLKPPEQAPLATTRLIELIDRARILPRGVLNMVTGDGSTGGALVRDPRIGAISFTGSISTGSTIAAASAPNLPKLSFELGGKSPFVLFADAALDDAVAAAAGSCYYLAGQGCLNATRFLVEESIADDFVEQLVAISRSWVVGDPMEAGTQMGPLISETQLSRVGDFVARGVSEGARVLCGGQRSDRSSGYYYEPTVVDGVAPGNILFDQEVFGPVASVTTFKGVDAAVSLANASVYGLASFVWTSDLALAHRVAAQIQAGTVWVNSGAARDFDLPFGGVKRSGIGRQSPRHLLDFFSEEKAVSVDLTAPRQRGDR